jgi:carbon storage regulator
MLVVTRKRNQSIMIRDDVEVKIIGIRENQVKIGIIAPKEVPVHRREVYERIQRGEPPRRKYPGVNGPIGVDVHAEPGNGNGWNGDGNGGNGNNGNNGW